MHAGPVLILGSTGQLGGELATALGTSEKGKVHALFRGDLGRCAQFDIDLPQTPPSPLSFPQHLPLASEL